MTPLVGITQLDSSPIDSARPAAVPPQGAGAPQTVSFGDMFADIAGEARETLRTGEAAAIAGVNGENSVQNVVRAMMTAEEHLRAAVAVRDRVVAAYQEISRMQI